MKILILVTYPIRVPMHGGQIRVNRLADAYEKAGFEVRVAGVLGGDHYNAEPGFLSFPSREALDRMCVSSFLMEDYAIGQLVLSDKNIFKSLFDQLEFVPDFIHVEQPWLFKAAVELKKLRKLECKIVYGSQNIEFELKRKILGNYFSEEVSSEMAALIEDVEVFAAKNADAVIAVSDHDASWLRGHTNASVLVAPNGVSEWNAKNVCAKNGANYKYAVFCASAHPPNMEGFFHFFGGGFGSLQPDQRLIAIGSVGPALAGDQRVHQSTKLAEKLDIAGLVPQNRLENLLNNAHCIVLPINQGGGTNLKTAEALWSRKYIVASSLAMRGFEDFMESPGVFIADTPREFKQKLRLAMSLPALELGHDEIDKRRSVLWSHTLRHVPDFVANLKSDNEK